jgi:LysR family nitrogen assimilation transcriptional regulator
MEIKQLRYFVKVAELNSVGRASDLLNIAQPTLSRQIQALELELKTDLFARTGRGVTLTVLGRRFLEHARGILHATDSAMDALNEGKTAYDGRVVTGFTPSVGRTMIPSFTEQFVQRFPKASLSIVEGYSSALTEQVLMGKLDFAILLNPVASPNLLIDPIATENLYLIGATPLGQKPREVKLEQLADVPLIMPHTMHTIRPLLEYEAARLGISLNISLEIDAVRSIVDLVEMGRGYTVMPVNSLRRDSHPRLSWQRIVKPVIEVTICLVRPMRGAQTALPTEAAALARSTLVELLAESERS